MNEGNGHGIVLFGANGQPPAKGEYARANAVQRAVNKLLKNDRNLQENYTRLLAVLQRQSERIDALDVQVAELLAEKDAC
jgi:hypothetical protein